jgi:sugar phosphate isomerase/epimerase
VLKPSRREFLIGTGSALAASSFVFGQPSRLFGTPLGKPIGLQLYTVSAQLEKDYDGTLRQIAAIGYREVELAGLFGKKPAEIKRSLEAAGLHCGSVHMGMEGMEKALTLASEIGAKYVISSITLPNAPNPAKFDLKSFLAQMAALTLDDYKSMAHRCNELGEQAKKAGLQFGYHNHNSEFKPFPGGIGYDELLRGTDSGLVKFELDCGWMAAAGHDPAAYLAKYPSRYRLLHIKDFQPTTNPSVSLEENSRPKPAELGRGHVDYRPIFIAAMKSQVEWYYVEQEPPFTDMPALEAIKVDFDYLQKLN